MKDRNTAIIVTVAAALLCGCPGLVVCLGGAIFAVISRIPDATYTGGMDANSALGYGLGGLCLGIVFIAIPIVVGVLLLRKKPAAGDTAVIPPSEPIPPAL